jgi:23S rRNA pseudouridine2605 synthase
MAEAVRLQRYLAAAGVAARRKCEELITAGRVQVNGKIARVLGTKVDPDRDHVTVDGEAVVALDTFYVLFNKPKGCITAVTDDRGRPTVMDYLTNVPVPVKPVGRLDFYTEGVLLLTNDGELAARLLAPASHVPKTYHVKIHGRLSPRDLQVLRDGVRLDDGTTTLPAEIENLPGESKHTWLAITIHEGKHRQIHRMIEAVGFYVDKLQRVAFANLTFHGLRIGDARELNQQELNGLRDLVGLDHSAVARGRWSTKREQTDIPRRARAKARAEAEEAREEGEAAGQRETAGGGRRGAEGERGRREEGQRGRREVGQRGRREEGQRGGRAEGPRGRGAEGPRGRGAEGPRGRGEAKRGGAGRATRAQGERTSFGQRRVARGGRRGSRV